ncbi:tetratricopeptide repeat protein [Bauldia litoralis]|uniref:tetratricopeptide repeat protein n=1 Tax=Bauldia litoralis TaxID=665467 RepID=UPI001113AB01|nr:adenylate cyclase [Bauldia litoralis]
MSLADSSTSDVGKADSPVSPEVVRQAVDRIVASADFSASERARNFLKYVVEETLEGRSDRIKAFTVAVEVFGRDDTFDAQNDPVVRIEAGRLRRALEHYYLLEGKDDCVVIEIPKGGYVPVFGVNRTEGAVDADADGSAVSDAPVAAAPDRTRRWRSHLVPGAIVAVVVAGVAAYATGMMSIGGGAGDSLPKGPTLLVLPFSDLGDGPVSALYSAALTDEVVSELARFKEITVYGVQTSRSVKVDADVTALKRDRDVAYVLEGSVRTDSERIRVSSRLLNSASGAVLWSRRFAYPLTASDLFGIQVETAEEVATAIAQPYGIVFRAEAARERDAPPDDLEAYLCTLRYYVYRAGPSAAKHAEVRDCLERAVAAFPSYATAWGLLGLVYVDEVRAGFNPSPDAVKRGLEAANTATRLDPDNVRALQALAMAYSYNRQPAEAFEVSQKAIALNPNDTELLGQLGLLTGLSGRMQEGRDLLERALAKNPGHSSFYRGALATIAYMQHDYEKALSEIDKTDLTGLPIYHGVAAIVYAQNGLDEKARAMAVRFQEMAPGFIPNLWDELTIRNIPQQSQLDIADGLSKAGVVVPSPPTGTSRIEAGPASTN